MLGWFVCRNVSIITTSKGAVLDITVVLMETMEFSTMKVLFN